jgi:hypothetical protein
MQKDVHGLEKTSEGLQSPFLQFPSRWRLLFLRLQAVGLRISAKQVIPNCFLCKGFLGLGHVQPFTVRNVPRHRSFVFNPSVLYVLYFMIRLRRLSQIKHVTITCRISGFSLPSLHITLLFFLHYLSRERFESFQMVALFVRYFSFQFDRFAQGD